MQDEANGVPVRTVKSFLTKIPSVFTGTHTKLLRLEKIVKHYIIIFTLHFHKTGSDLTCWITRHLDVEDQSKAFIFL
jgi:hypothetical protein